MKALLALMHSRTIAAVESGALMKTNARNGSYI